MTVVSDGFDIVRKPTNPGDLSPDNTAGNFAPERICVKCDCAQSVDRCWFCAGPTVENTRRALSTGKMRWSPEPEVE